jgi:hypothetical protein
MRARQEPPTPSLPGLTRQSILFVRLLRREMDARVKPAHDAERVYGGRSRAAIQASARYAASIRASMATMVMLPP